MKILVLNVGSSSQKCRLYEMGDSLPEQPQAPLWEANADWSEHQGETHCKITTSTGQSLEEKLPTTSRQDVLAHLLKTLWSSKTQVIAQASEIDIVGHRVVHGGQEYRESTKITPAVKDAIKRLSLIDPLHNPLNLEDIEVRAGHQALWLSRHQPSILRPARRSAPGARPGILAPGDLPHRQRVLISRYSRRSQYRYHHGVYPARRFDDGQSLWIGRSRHPHLPDAPKRVLGRPA